MLKNIETWRLITIVICVALLMGGGADALFSMGSLGYTSGYEGVRASFSGIDWTLTSGKSGKTYEPPDVYKPWDGPPPWISVLDLPMGNSFSFDADDPMLHAPNLVGEMTNAFVPEKSVRPNWVSPELWRGIQYIKNPVDTYQWDLPNPKNEEETIAYIMEEWLVRMYVSITAEWTENPDPLISKFDKEYWGNTRYINTKIWIELDISPIWYFEGADQVYFGLGKVVCSDFAKGKYGVTDEDYSPTEHFSVTPSSAASYRYLFNAKYAEEEISPVDPKTYKGRILNPEIFVDQMFIKLDLNDFGTDAWSTLVSDNWKGDAATWGFDVHVFVVGEWKVQDIEEIPEEYGREPKYQYGFDYYIARFLRDPRAQFWLIVGVLALMFLVLAIFAPGFLLVIFSLIQVWTGRSKERRKKK